MTARAWVLIAVAACRSEQPAAKVLPHSPYEHVCPLGAMYTKPWVHEVFPGCPPPQIDELGVICDGPCPTPCRSTIQVHDLPPHTYELAYDAGRLISFRDR